MLVITRREGEEVVIGDPNNPIGVVRIASIKGDRVRVAFDFPRHIDVHRREVAEQILASLGSKAAAPINGHGENGGHAENGHHAAHEPGGRHASGPTTPPVVANGRPLVVPAAK